MCYNEKETPLNQQDGYEHVKQLSEFKKWKKCECSVECNCKVNRVEGICQTCGKPATWCMNFFRSGYNNSLKLYACDDCVSDSKKEYK